MILYKCAKCGAGELEPLGDGKKAMCVYCNSVMVLPTLDPEAFNHANALRKEMKFDQAEMAFQRIVSEYPQDSESYWNLVLCRYGIEYVEEKDEDDPDGAVRNYVPTCHRMSYDSILNDSDYQKALQYADGYSKRIYEEEAQKIDRILKRAVYIAQTQPEYDIFISYKESDNAIGGSKERTEDSFIAQEIYDELKKKHPNLNIFLSRVTLSQVAAGLEYEPIIFSALNSAKMMILVGTSKENLESTWVKNEWSRYRKMMGNGKKRAIAVVYRGMDPKTDFPDELRMHAIQGTEAKGFYLQDFIPGVEEYLGIKANAMGFEAEQIYQAGNVRQSANLCIRAEQALAREKYDEAEAYLEKALDADPESSRAWWGMVVLASRNFTKVNREKAFEQYKDVLSNWLMVQQYAIEPELSVYSAQMEKYKAICDEAYEAHTSREQLKSKKARITELFQLIKEKTEGGTYFEEDNSYGINSANAKELMSLLEEVEDTKQIREFNQFRQQYEINYAKYLDLLEFKKTDPMAKWKASSEYVKRKNAAETVRSNYKMAKRKVNNFSIFNVLISVAVVAFCYFANCGSEQSQKILKGTIYIVPLLASLMVFSTILGIFLNKGASAYGDAVEHFSEFSRTFLISLVPTLIGYFAIQYWIYLEAKAIEPGLSWVCIFAGVVYLLYGIVAVIGIVLLFLNFIAAIIFMLVGFGILKLPFFKSMTPISDKALFWCYHTIFDVLLIVVIVAAAVCFILYIRNRSIIKKCRKMQEEFERKSDEFDQFQEEAINEMIKPYKGFVSPEYLTEFEVNKIFRYL